MEERPRKKVKRSGGPPAPKLLASSEKAVRDSAFEQTRLYLESIPSSSSVDDWTAVDERMNAKEMDKLWSGLWYYFWMSDKPLVQQSIADKLAQLALFSSSASQEQRGAAAFAKSMAYTKAFWKACAREWSSLDKHRVDKFYLLVRRFLNVQFRIVLRAKCDPQAIKQYTRALTGSNKDDDENGGGTPLAVQDDKVPASLCYHLSDIALEELEKVLSNKEEEDDNNTEQVGRLLEPFVHVLINARTKVMYERTHNTVFEPLVNENSDDYPAVREGISKDRVLEMLFARASEKETNDVARKRLYSFCSRHGYEGN